MFHIYILQSLTSGKYYIGSCENIGNRVKQHNDGKVKSTKAFTPWKLVYEETFSRLREARIREHQLKSWKSRDALKKLIEKHF